MKSLHWSIVLLALLLAAIAMVPMVSAVENLQESGGKLDIVSLFDPVNKDIRSNIVSFTDNKTLVTKNQNLAIYSAQVTKKYQKNLDLILDSLENKTKFNLSLTERDNLKKIIVQEHIKRVYWEVVKAEKGISDKDFKSITVDPINGLKSSENAKLSSLPDALTLKQVSADVNGGTGRDGANIAYTVNGGNQLYQIDWNSGTGYTLYQCHFRDEDVPDSSSSDAIYDAYRLRVYGTIEDLQGFFIYSNGTIEFGNDWDNGYSFGYIIGQHGQNTVSYGSSTQIYISNVWNHAMSTTDRNSNMAKITYSF